MNEQMNEFKVFSVEPSDTVTGVLHMVLPLPFPTGVSCSGGSVVQRFNGETQCELPILTPSAIPLQGSDLAGSLLVMLKMEVKKKKQNAISKLHTIFNL
jgi:hypothetical protein